MRALIVLLAALMIVPQLANAQDLVPATSEDIEQFDAQLGMLPEQRPAKEQVKAKEQKKDNFGASVAEEAKRLKAEGADKQKAFGKWVSSQKKKDDQKGQKDVGGARKDAQVSDPGKMKKGKGK